MKTNNFYHAKTKLKLHRYIKPNTTVGKTGYKLKTTNT
jgi:hypothetical protein